MDWINILQKIFEVCIIPLLGVLTTIAIKAIMEKAKAIAQDSQNALVQKYTILLAQIVSDCVIATNQTYVESLKNKNAFDAEAQKVALEKTYNAVMTILTDEAKKHLSEVYGDVQEYVLTLIEAEVNIHKISKLESI